MEPHKILTQKVGPGFAEASSVVLDLTPNTLLVFKPGIHNEGVRGYLVRYKKSGAQDWKTLRDNDFQKVTLPAQNKVEFELKTETVSRLVQVIEEHRQIAEGGIKRGKTEYIVAESDKIVVLDDAKKKGVFESILERGYSSEFWDLLIESEPELATRLSAGHLYAEKIKTLQEFKERLRTTYPETAGPNSWQNWIYKNKWLFGVNYINTIQRARINIAGSMPDFIFLTADNFVDVLEIKLPDDEVILPDPNHPEAYRWSGKTNEAIGQVVAYIDSIERNQLALEREIERVYKIKASCVRPRGFILLGKKEGWDDYKRAGLRKLNASLHGIEILTYWDLIRRGKEIAEMYKNEASSISI